jgi:D-glycero-alpha-D-manno-heptose-7-phosphate kinase
MVCEGSETLTNNRPCREFGELLNCAWVVKRNLDSGVPTSEIDEIYAHGLEVCAWRGKLLGAGGGGFLLFLPRPNGVKSGTPPWQTANFFQPG